MSTDDLSHGLALIAAGLDMITRTDWAAMALPQRLATMDTLETDLRRGLAVSTAIAVGTLYMPLIDRVSGRGDRFTRARDVVRSG